MSGRELTTDMTDEYLDRLQSLAHYYRDIGNEAARYRALGSSSEVDRGVTGTRSPDARMISLTQHPDPLEDECRRWLKSLEGSLERLYKRMADRNPVHDADARFKQAG